MNISRNFLLMGCLYLLGGILFGMYMGGSGDHAMRPLHAHINLLGFTLMSIFGLVYRQFPSMTSTIFAPIHFWLHQCGVLVLMIMLFLMLSGRITEASMAPVAPISETAILLGIVSFAWNFFKHGK